MDENNKKRLVEILKSIPFKSYSREQIADHLAANGVVAELPKIDLNIYDKEEIHENCTVQILSNSVTGKQSVGWWHGSAADMPVIRREHND